MYQFGLKALITSSLIAASSYAVAFDRLDLEEAANFNLVVFEDFQPPRYSSFTHAVAIGGDMLLSNYGFAVEVSSSEATISAYVGGDFNFEQGRIFGGSVLVGGNADGVVTKVRDTLTEQQIIVDQIDVGIDFEKWQNDLQLTSQSYSDINTTGSAEFKWGSTYALNGNCESALQVFELDGTLLSKTRDLRLSCIPEGASILFNVSGDQSGMSSLSTNMLLPFKGKTLFNFYEATQLRFQYTQVHASILAPYADVVDATGELFGTAIANSWHGSMTLKLVPYLGYNAGVLACEGPSTP